MLRSLYAYKGTHARTLEFQAGEKFLEIGQSCDPNWIHVISERGALGYVPKNYVTLEESQPEDILEFIHGSIEANLNASERGGSNSRSEHEALHKLVELRQKWYSKAPPSSQHPSKRPAPPPPQRTSSQLSVDSVGSPSGGQIIPCASRVYLLSSLNNISIQLQFQVKFPSLIWTPSYLLAAGLSQVQGSLAITKTPDDNISILYIHLLSPQCHTCSHYGTIMPKV